VVQKERKDKINMKILKNLVIFLVFFSSIFLLLLHPSYAWLGSWQYRKKEQINQTGSSTLINFPYLINGTGFSLNGEPIQYVWTIANITPNNTTFNYLYYNNFTSYVVVNGSDNAQLPFEVERGNGTSYNPTQVWDSNYRLVYHFENKTGNSNKDSTQYGMDFTPYNNPAYISGYFAKGMNFTKASSQYLSTPLSISGVYTNITLEAWIYVYSFSAFGTDGGAVIDADDGNYRTNQMVVWNNGSIQVRCGAPTTIIELYSPAITANAWHYVAVTYTYIGSQLNMSIYVDGNLVASKLNTTKCENPQTAFNIGRHPSSIWYYDGKVDEVRISNVSRSADYIKRQYLMGLARLGAEEIVNITPQITIYLPTNTSYFYSNNFQFSFKATDDSSATFQLKAFLDGNSVYDSSSYQNNTQINLTQNLNLPKQYNFTVWANDTKGATSSLTVIFTIKDFEIQQIAFNSIVYETTTQSFTETIRVNFDLVSNITSDLFWNSTDEGSCSQSMNSTHIILSQAIDIPLVQANNTAVNFFFRNYITYTNTSSATVDSVSNSQNVLFGYQPAVSLSGLVAYNSTYYSNSTIFNFALNNLTASRVNIRIYANNSLIKDDTNLSFVHTPLTDALYLYQYSISFAGSERYFGSTTSIYYLYTLQMNHNLNLTFGFWDNTPQQSFNFSVYSPYAPYVNCSLLNLYNYTYYRKNMSVWYTYTFPVNNSPITLNFVCRDFFNTNSSIYEYPVYIIQIKPVDEEVGVYNTSLWLDPSTNKTAIIRFVAISPLFNQSILYEKLNSTLWLIVPTNTWILTVQTLYSLQYFTQTYVLRDWTKYDMPICIPENKPQNLQTAYTTVPIDWSFIIRRGDTGCVKTIDKATNSLGNYFGFYFYTLPGIYTVSKLENGTEIFISALRGESENLVDLQKIIYQWQQTLRKIATIVRITTVNVLGGDNSTIIYVTTSMEDDYRLDVEKDGTVIYSQAFPSSQNFTLTLLWRTVGINPDDKLTFKLYGSNGLIYQVISTATGKIYKYPAVLTGIILTVLLVITFLKPINIEKIFILSLVTLFAAFYFIPQTEPNIYLNMLGFGVIVLVVSSGVIVWKTIR